MKTLNTPSYTGTMAGANVLDLTPNLLLKAGACGYLPGFREIVDAATALTILIGICGVCLIMTYAAFGLI